jgi:hypothetical protein
MTLYALFSLKNNPNFRENQRKSELKDLVSFKKSEIGTIPKNLSFSKPNPGRVYRLKQFYLLDSFAASLRIER